MLKYIMNFTNYNYWLFDWDGTLADTYSLHFDTYVEMANRNGIDFTKETFQDSIGNWIRSAKNCGYDDLEKFKIEYQNVAIELSKNLKTNKNAIEVLKSLKKLERKIAIVTSSQREQVLEQIGMTGVSQYIDLLVTANDTEKIKPDPEPIVFAIKELNATKDEIIFVGDTETDIIAGGKAGVFTVWYNPPHNREVLGDMDFEGFEVDYEIEDLGALLGS